jgi:hypothetical protein
MSRPWRRRQIIATYAAYSVATILTIVHAHATLSSGVRGMLNVVFGLAALAFIASLAWVVAPSVRYGLSNRASRQPALSELKQLKKQGVTARQAHAMFTRPADERQRAVREHAQSVAYRIVGLVVTLVAIYLIFAPRLIEHAWLPSTEVEQVGLLAGFALLFSTLPAAVIAWSEPDPVPDDLS